MSDQPNDQQPAADDANLQDSIAKLTEKNRELIGELRQAKRKADAVPDGVDVQELIRFRQEHEQQKLESAGQYEEAKRQLQEQYDRDTAALKAEAERLQARVRELELVSPAVSALSELVHDPDAVLKLKLPADRIERDPDGSVVVVDGLQRTPVKDWAQSNLPAWMLKAPAPRGSGAPVGGGGGAPAGIPAGTVNPFDKETFSLTEQGRLFRTNRALYDQLKSAAKR
jgi:hypothetical protein